MADLHLTRKIARVVSGAERDLAARRMAADLVNPDDLDAFMKALDCDAVVTARVLGPGRTYAVGWSQVHIGLGGADDTGPRPMDGRSRWAGN